VCSDQGELFFGVTRHLVHSGKLESIGEQVYHNSEVDVDQNRFGEHLFLVVRPTFSPPLIKQAGYDCAKAADKF
jgi:hypothetical protein